ncbi:hypothetical protein J3E69DRAFT_198784 [Trichoderma sp. SZMC 28015]
MQRTFLSLSHSCVLSPPFCFPLFFLIFFFFLSLPARHSLPRSLLHNCQNLLHTFTQVLFDPARRKTRVSRR